MSDLFWLSEAQMRRIEPYFQLLHGIAKADARWVIGWKMGTHTTFRVASKLGVTPWSETR